VGFLLTKERILDIC